MTDPFPLGPTGPVHYPESDAEPVAETDWHLQEMMALIEALKVRYEGEPEVYVAGNLLLYYEEGNPKARVAPDAFVVFGVPRGKRRVYKLWEEGRPPDVVFELTSKSTWMEDEGSKKALYRRLGVREYLLFDPLGDYLEPRLQGFRVGDDDWGRIAPGPGGSVTSEVLGLRFTTQGERLYAVDTATGEPLLRSEQVRERLHETDRERREADRARREADSARQEADRARQEADRARREAEAESHRLRRRLAELEGKED